MKSLKVFLFSGVVVFGSAMLSTPVADATEAAMTQSASIGAMSAAVSELVGKPEAGKGLVVFFRKKAFKGGGTRFIVRENGVELGKLKSGTWFAVQTEPGKHTYIVHSEAKDVTNIEVEAGQTYFVAGTVTFGVFAGRPNLAPADAASFEELMLKMKQAKPLN